MTKEKIIIYSKPGCVACTLTKRVFDGLDIQYESRELLDVDKEKMDSFVLNGFMQAPIVETETETWAGYDAAKIADAALRAARA